MAGIKEVSAEQGGGSRASGHFLVWPNKRSKKNQKDPKQNLIRIF